MAEHLMAKLSLLSLTMLEDIRPVLLDRQPIRFAATNATHAVRVIAPRIHGWHRNSHSTATPVGAVLFRHVLLNQRETGSYARKKPAQFHASSRISLNASYFHRREANHADNLFNTSRLKLDRKSTRLISSHANISYA